ncbi:MAG: hypothetical protein EOP61_27515, partial [Sphingomonadales bacterium]
MRNATSRVALALLAGSGLCGTAHSERPELGAAISLDQVAEAQFSGVGDDVTYTEIAGVLSGRISNRKIVASGTYRLSYRIPEIGDIDQTVDQNGVLRVQAQVIDEWLTMEGGAIVTRSRINPSGAAPQNSTGNAKNLTETYSTYIQPTFAHRFGDLVANATYRYSYIKNEASDVGTAADPLNNRFDESTRQQVTSSIGMRQSSLPFDWSATVEYARENASNLDEHTRSITAVAEVIVPIAYAWSVVGSGGYERTKFSERQALIDPLTGLPVRDPNGRFVVDPNSPRFITYDMS